MIDYERTYSLADIAKKMNRPRPTLQSWKEQFSEFIPSVGSGRSRRYEDEALEIFMTIEKLKGRGEPKEKIRDVLRSSFTMKTKDDSNDLLPKPVINTIQDGYEAFLQEIKAQNNLLREQNDTFHRQNQERKKEFEELREQFEHIHQTSKASHEAVISNISRRDELLMKTLKEMMEQKKKESFWSRLFNSKKITVREQVNH
ncbi:MerR HTH family regulatory protein [Thalassobacillus cyri]|uniref:MerR HTH family regulatory protein n=1 Tax=Thalassobacillus cyri TaxID=571932 RepID=A0A1H3ZHZ9_9BACI|nr:MerR family transcriptional regulator [Thalassobacillus cyri]SEA22924.1 MerR HTH family regulatory protein [Thalassobacillus cyri]